MQRKPGKIFFCQTSEDLKSDKTDLFKETMKSHFHHKLYGWLWKDFYLIAFKQKKRRLFSSYLTYCPVLQNRKCSLENTNLIVVLLIKKVLTVVRFFENQNVHFHSRFAVCKLEDTVLWPKYFFQDLINFFTSDPILIAIC